MKRWLNRAEIALVFVCVALVAIATSSILGRFVAQEALLVIQYTAPQQEKPR